MHFARLLRAAGLRLGPDRVVDCVQALELADCNRRDDWYWTMSAVFLSKEEQRPIFDQAFRIFWRDPKLVEKMMNALLPKTYGRAGKPEQEQSQRLSDALFDQKKAAAGTRGAEDRARCAAHLLLARSAAAHGLRHHVGGRARRGEEDAARAAPAAAADPHPAQRAQTKDGKNINLRATLRESLRDGGDVIPLVRAAPIEHAIRRWWCCATSPAR